MVHKVCALLLIVVSVVYATAETKDDATHRPKHHIKHGRQDFKTPDGQHNVHFDHEAMLGKSWLPWQLFSFLCLHLANIQGVAIFCGCTARFASDLDGHPEDRFCRDAAQMERYDLLPGTVGDEGAFDKMEPKEAKYRLGLIAKRMDKNLDGYVSREELTDWIVMSYRILDEQEALEDFRHQDDDTDEKVSWEEYLKHEFNLNEKEIRQRDKKDKKHAKMIAKMEMAKRVFNAADTDKDHFLNQKEFFAFSHPQNYAHMHKLAVDQRLAEYDQDGDKKFTLEEFHAAAETEDDKEMIANEQEIFGYLDRNHDGVVDRDEIHQWVLGELQSGAEDEADDLVRQADTDNDEKLSEKEIVEKHEVFVGSAATNEGKQLHFIRQGDEDL